MVRWKAIYTRLLIYSTLSEYTLTIYKDDRTINKCYQDITTVRIKDENVIVRLLQTQNTLCPRRIETFLKRLFLCHKHAKTA